MNSENKIVLYILVAIGVLTVALLAMDYQWCRDEGYSAFQCTHNVFFEREDIRR